MVGSVGQPALIVGESLRDLIDPLADRLSQPLDDPFAPELVAVANLGVRQWTTRQLSRRLGASQGGVTQADGIVANIEFPFPDGLLTRLLGAPERDPWALSNLVWVVLDELQQGAGDAALGPAGRVAPGTKRVGPVPQPSSGTWYGRARHLADLFRPLLAPPTRADPPLGYRQRRRRQGSPDCPKPTLGGFPAVAVRAVASGSGPHLRTEPRRAVGRADRRPRPQPSPRRPATAPDPVRTLGAAAGVVFAAACARRALRRGGVVAHPVAATVASHARAGHHETTWGLASRPSPRPPATAATHCCPGGLDRPRRGRSCGGLRATQALRHTTNTRNPARRRRSDDFNWPSAPTARSGSWPPRCLPPVGRIAA